MKHETSALGNPAQEKAIRHVEGPAFVIAGPGSGKTFVIIRRIISLINSGISPSTILVITFTKAAAIEMQSRFTKETNSKYPEVLFGTFHSIFYQILKISAPKRETPLTLISEKQKYAILGEELANLRLEIRNKRKELLQKGITDLPNEIETGPDTIKSLLSEISKIKNEGKGPESRDANLPLYEYFPDIYRDYTEYMKSQSMIDFDDMVLLCHRLLDKSPEILRLWQERFKYILIDEYQDINNIQFQVVKLLCKESKNLFVVGDDDQSIYGFRGSDPAFMLSFNDYFPDAKKIVLNINYRCSKNILSAAKLVINENKNRFKKDIIAGKEDSSGICKGFIFEDKNAQYSAIIDSIKNMSLSVQSVRKPSDIAIIFRTNMEASLMARALSSAKIPFFYKEKVTSIYDKSHIKDILAYLDFAYEGKRSDFLMIMNKPVRYFSRDCAGKEIILEKDLIAFYKTKGKIRMLDRVQRLYRDMKMVSTIKPYLAINYIRKVVGYDKYVTELHAGDKKGTEMILEELDTFEKSAMNYMTYKGFKEFIEASKKELEELKERPSLDKNGVRIMTMHASKGLEFPVVFLPDLNEGIMPSRKSITEKDREEERRMLYVAMTRAKDELYLSYVSEKKGTSLRMSSFLRPIADLFNKC